MNYLLMSLPLIAGLFVIWLCRVFNEWHRCQNRLNWMARSLHNFSAAEMHAWRVSMEAEKEQAEITCPANKNA